jgi:hypothetical protein
LLQCYSGLRFNGGNSGMHMVLPPVCLDAWQRWWCFECSDVQDRQKESLLGGGKRLRVSKTFLD